MACKLVFAIGVTREVIGEAESSSDVLQFFSLSMNNLEYSARMRNTSSARLFQTSIGNMSLQSFVRLRRGRCWSAQHAVFHSNGRCARDAFLYQATFRSESNPKDDNWFSTSPQDTGGGWIVIESRAKAYRIAWTWLHNNTASPKLWFTIWWYWLRAFTVRHLSVRRSSLLCSILLLSAVKVEERAVSLASVSSFRQAKVPLGQLMRVR